MRTFKVSLIVALCNCMGACADAPFDTSELVKPSPRCMVAPGALQTLKDGDDLVVAYASAARSYGRETSKLRCLQRYVRTVTKEN
jgi:hypothetical protein